MELSDLLHGLQRAPWLGIARNILIRAGYDPSRGFPKTLKAILSEKTVDQDKVKLLIEGLTEHVVSGEKLLQFVRLTGRDRSNLQKWIVTKRKHANDLSEAFPGVAPESTIIPFKSQDPTSVGFVRLDDGIAAIFTSTRSYVHSVPLPASSLKSGFADGFERLVGYKRIFVQAYDAIWLPDNCDFAVFAIDLPNGVPKAYAIPGSAYLNKLVRQQLGRSLCFANFWHSVDGLYAGADGKLVDYGFSAGGQSVNQHKARRRNSECLRKAVYDAAGAAAIKASGKQLELFKVAMQWTLKHDDGVVTEPEALIPGVAADLNKPMPSINHCIVRDCLTTGDLGFVVCRLAPHIHWT